MPNASERCRPHMVVVRLPTRLATCRCSARYILIIEKDAIFQRLTEDRLCDRLPCVLVTAKGLPDLATRQAIACLGAAAACAARHSFSSSGAATQQCWAATPHPPPCHSRVFLSKLSGCYPWLPLLALVDWNPSGVTILNTYKHGAQRSGMEAAR